jgi:hypothetical protein
MFEEEDCALAPESVPEFLPFIRQNPRNNLKLRPKYTRLGCLMHNA